MGRSKNLCHVQAIHYVSSGTASKDSKAICKASDSAEKRRSRVHWRRTERHREVASISTISRILIYFSGTYIREFRRRYDSAMMLLACPSLESEIESLERWTTFDGVWMYSGGLKQESPFSCICQRINTALTLDTLHSRLFYESHWSHRSFHISDHSCTIFSDHNKIIFWDKSRCISSSVREINKSSSPAILLLRVIHKLSINKPRKSRKVCENMQNNKK